MTLQTQADAGGMATSQSGHPRNKLPVVVMCSWQKQLQGGRTSLQALTSSNAAERASVYLIFAQNFGLQRDISPSCMLIASGRIKILA